MRLSARRRRLDDITARVPLVPPWTVAEFLSWVSDEFRRDIVLSPWPPGAAPHVGRCGLLLGSPGRFTIKYDATRSLRHQRQAVFHEVAHILCHHPGEPFRPTDSVLTEGIDPRAIEFIMRRSTFDTPTEYEAEIVGTHLAVLSRGPIDAESSGTAHRMRGAFGAPA